MLGMSQGYSNNLPPSLCSMWASLLCQCLLPWWSWDHDWNEIRRMRLLLSVACLMLTKNSWMLLTSFLGLNSVTLCSTCMHGPDMALAKVSTNKIRPRCYSINLGFVWMCTPVVYFFKSNTDWNKNSATLKRCLFLWDEQMVLLQVRRLDSWLCCIFSLSSLQHSLNVCCLLWLHTMIDLTNPPVSVTMIGGQGDPFSFGSVVETVGQWLFISL